MVKNFAEAIIVGLRNMGKSDEAMRRSAGISAATLNAITAGKRKFTDRQLQSLEELAGETIGAIAARAIEPDGGPLTELSAGWQEFYRLTRDSRKQSQPSRRRSKPKRVAKGMPVRVAG